jgi:hypothetical protein
MIDVRPDTAGRCSLGDARAELASLCTNAIVICDGWMRIGPTRLRVECLQHYSDAGEAITLHMVDAKEYVWTPSFGEPVAGRRMPTEIQGMARKAVAAQLEVLDAFLHNWTRQA